MNAAEVAVAFNTLALGEATGVTELEGGSSRAYRVDRADDVQVMFKIYRDYMPDTSAKEVYVTDLLKDVRVPITRYIVADSSRTKLPYRYAVTNYLEGQTAGALANHQDIAGLYQQMGGLLRALHEVKMPSYGDLNAQGVMHPSSTNTKFVQKQIDYHLGQFRLMGGDTALAARLQTTLNGRFDAIVPYSQGAVFAHDDLHPNNVLALEDADGTLTLSGLIDFGSARATDPVSDLAKCLFCCEHEAPGSAAHILAGYGSIDHPNPIGAIAYYTTLHRITMWWWLRKVGFVPMPDTPSDLMDKLRAEVGL